MVMRADRALWRWWVRATTVIASAGAVAVGLLGTSPVAVAQPTMVDCDANPGALQPALIAAAPGATLRVRGTCIGNFTLAKTVTLVGLRNAVLDGNHAGTTVDVRAGVQATLRNLVITDGSATLGGGILNDGSLTLTRSTVQNNTAFRGGGIISTGGSTLMLTSSVVQNNTATDGGGGIYNSGMAILDRSTVQNNSAPTGGGIFNDSGSLTLTGSTVQNNTATISGGGIFNFAGTVTLVRSTVSGNVPNNCTAVSGC
ncbi:hypothetical protein [Streptomyces barringtoniae]|uniref:hypothetical protein n=1 Tax=Streptomyces barringtoniae TaxID=2892029 RepID=UPI001E386E55|nr:hypothetical protein [Streptomyces barringtoniae]MCC5479874.1 hypothetical protein [Streptomyces barringtoniae]